MKKFHVLVKDRILDSIINELEELNFTVHKLYEVENHQQFIDEVKSSINAMVTTYATGEASAAFISQFPKLGIISHFGVGYNNIDTNFAKQNGIVVTNTPDVLTDETADLAMALTLATVREIPQADNHLRSGKWQSEGAFHLTSSLRGRKMGVLGLGRIGKAIAKRAEAFGVEVAYHGRNKQDVPYKYYDNLKEMASGCDLLILAAPGGEKTDKIVNLEILKALGNEGILINIGRGSLVDQPALINALQNGTIHSAGLDVYDDEPNIPKELIDLKNTVLTPHVGSASKKTRRDMGSLVVENIRLCSIGLNPKTPVPEAPPQ